jgi:hypothetical protein
MSDLESNKFYLIYVWGDVEPEIHGPYETEDERDIAAGVMRHQNSDDGGIYWLDITPDRTPATGSFSGAYMEVLERTAALAAGDTEAAANIVDRFLDGS